MIPKLDDPLVYLGDVYILQDGIIVGMVSGIKFSRYPRVLLARFFSPPDKMAAMVGTPKPAAAQTSGATLARAVPELAPTDLSVVQCKVPAHHGPLRINHPTAQPVPLELVQTAIASPNLVAAVAPIGDTDTDDNITVQALQLIADESGVQTSDLADDVSFADLGIDSLMSLVITEKVRTTLGVKVSGSLFLDYPTIGDLRSWLEDYYS